MVMAYVSSCSCVALHQLSYEASTTQKNNLDLGKRQIIIAFFRGCIWGGKS